MNDDAALFDARAFEETGVSSRAPKIIPRLTDPEEPHWTERFGDLDRYDWFDKQWLEQNVGPLAFFPVPLTQGYFGILSPRDHARMTEYPDGTPKKFHVAVKRDERGEIVSAYMNRAGRAGEPSSVRAHRELLNCLDTSDEVDHVNGLGLDNRANPNPMVNLVIVDRSINVLNTVRVRAKHAELPRGVEYRRKSDSGEPLYGWIRAKRTSGAMVKDKNTGLWKPAPAKIFRSEEVWPDPNFAHEMYQQELERIAENRKRWAHAPETVNLPVFPPRLRRARRLDLEDLVQTILRLNEEARQLADIPF